LIATAVLESDDELERFAKDLGVLCYRGSVNDVLGRMSAAVASAKADLIVEMLGDNPLVRADLIDDVVDFYHQGITITLSMLQLNTIRSCENVQFVSRN